MRPFHPRPAQANLARMSTKPQTKAKPARAKKKAAQTAKRSARSNSLNARQERFCQRVAAGMPASRAYAEAGYTGTGNVADTTGARLLRKAQIKDRVAELLRKDSAKVVLTKEMKRNFYLEVVNDPRQKMTDRLRASELDAKIAGDFAPDQHVVETGPKTLESIRDRATEVSAALDRNARRKMISNGSEPTTPSGLSRWKPAITAG